MADLMLGFGSGILFTLAILAFRWIWRETGKGMSRTDD